MPLPRALFGSHGARRDDTPTAGHHIFHVQRKGAAMTKQRRPLSFARALTRISDLLGFDGCAQVLEKSESWVRKLSDPDTEREISLQDARRLDAAYQRAGGIGAPFLECYAFQLELADAGDCVAPELLLNAIGKTAKEYGEANAAALDAVKNGNSPASRLTALREIEEAVESLQHLAGQLGGKSISDGG